MPDDEADDFGKGAGFFVDAVQEPWAANFRMRSYIESELPALIAEHFPADMTRQGITGHSMGGHAALTIALLNPDRFRVGQRLRSDRVPAGLPVGREGSGRVSRDRTGTRGASMTRWP